jgi:hypothetical protein
MTETDRKLVEIKRKRLPLKKLLQGREIRDAMAEIEKFRRQFNEQEFLYGGHVYLEVTDYDRIDAVCKRPETDKEYNLRMDGIRAKEQAKLEREHNRAIREEQRRLHREAEAARAVEEQRLKDLETMKAMVRKLGLSAKEIEQLSQ